MGRETTISWTDASFNPWIGCTKVSPGCDNCYAETMDKRWGGKHWGKVRVFCGSQCDIMDDEAPEGIRSRLWDLVDSTPYLTWLLLTKRPQRYARYLPFQFQQNNYMLGTTCENQQFYNSRWPFLRIEAYERGVQSFVSYEPALGPIVMEDWLLQNEEELTDDCRDYPDWLIFGGETGNGRRPMDVEWAKRIKDECAVNDVAFFMKQMGARTPAQASYLIPAELLIHNFPE